MATTEKTKSKSSVKKPAPLKKMPLPMVKKNTVATKKHVAAKRPAALKKTAPVKKTAKKPVKTPVKKGVKKPVTKAVTALAKKGKTAIVERYRCRLCGYIYSPLRGEPHNGIPEGTEFDDLPDTYVCPVCGQQGKGRIGKWGFEAWRPTRYVCSICGYVYDEKRGEPHRRIKPGTKFEDLPDDYTCPVCAIDPRISVRIGKVFKQGFEPLQV
ncbi:MAG: rubredoxin [Methanoregula sp.]|jgi:rubredoxin|nr:rubredoxin [Methanoregula sp.]